MKGPEQWAGISASSALADDPGGDVLDMLEFVESHLRGTVQKGIAVVKSSIDNTARHRLGDIHHR